jgi:hypothetical protein
MRVTGTILMIAALGAASAAQTAPASQTVVKPNAPQTQVQTGPSSLKSPFAPKMKGAGAPKSAPQAAAKPDPNAAKKPAAGSTPHAQAKTAQPITPVKSKQAVVSKPVVTPKVVTPKVNVVRKQANAPKKNEAPKKATAGKVQTPAKPVAPAALVQASATTPSAPSQPAQKPMPNPGKRDPFVSPIAQAAMRGASNCTTGKRCLAVDQIVLKGIVLMKEGNFALVENVARRPYVLREKDALFNGTVEKITADSVVFQETGSDILGRTTSREVVKKVSVPSV